MLFHSGRRVDNAGNRARQPLSSPNHHGIAHARFPARVPNQDEVCCLRGEDPDARHDLSGQPAGYVHRLLSEVRHIGPTSAQAAKRRLAVGAA
jgi:hypothetical protein